MEKSKIRESPIGIADLVGKLYLADKDLDLIGRDARVFPPPVEPVFEQISYPVKTDGSYYAVDNCVLESRIIARTF